MIHLRRRFSTCMRKVSAFEGSPEVDSIVQRSKKAQIAYSKFTQEQVDEVFRRAALAANMQRIPLAKLAVSETHIGNVEDKVIKNHFASEYIYNKYKHEKTCGVVEFNADSGVTKVAEPVGVVAGIIPTTNPTSTAIFKCLLALKTRNSIVISPHPRAIQCTIEAAKVILNAAVEAGAPEDVVTWLDHPTMAMSGELMRHPDISMILATGGDSMVHSAMSSAHAALGVGAGNTPAVIDETADVKTAVNSILLSKSFDNGVICASEQSVVVVDSLYEEVKQEFLKRGAYFLKPDELDATRQTVIVKGRVNANVVGQSANDLAKLIGISVPDNTRIIIGEVSEVGPSEALSYEKLCPILAMYRVSDYKAALDKAESLINFAGIGHTSCLYTNPLSRDNIKAFQDRMKTVRILINSPASQGAIGDLYNFHLDPSMTLGCGTWANNSISSNVKPSHLLNFKTVTERRENMLWFRVPPKIYFEDGCLEIALKDLAHKKKAFVVTDKPLFDMGVSRKVTDLLDTMGVKHMTYYHVEPDPTLLSIQGGVDELKDFKPDVIIAIGGGSPMDAAKIMWLLYEHPETSFEGVANRFMDIRKRVYELPTLGNKAELVCVPTSSGTGSEVTPFAVVTDHRTGNKYPLADYALTPNMAIIDPQLVMSMPPKLTAYGGIDALTHALESYVSVCSTEFTRGLSREAIKLLFEYLPRSYARGDQDPEAKQRVHYAATVAGMAFANAFLGVCHSMAHKIGAHYHVPHGLANALLISHVIAYNATDAPYKQAIFPQYKYPQAKRRYAEIARDLDCEGANDDELVAALIAKVEGLKAAVDIPKSLSVIMGEKRRDEYFNTLDVIAEEAFDDQCTGANPRYPLIKDLRQMLANVWDHNC